MTTESMFLGEKMESFIGWRVKTRGFLDAKNNGKKGKIVSVENGKFVVVFNKMRTKWSPGSALSKFEMYPANSTRVIKDSEMRPTFSELFRCPKKHKDERICARQGCVACHFYC